MKNTINSLIISLLAITTALAQNGSRSFSVVDFNKLSIGSAFSVNVTKGNNFSVSAKGEKQDLDQMEATTDNKQLQIAYKHNNGHRISHKKVLISITMPNLSSARFSGASDSKIVGFSENQLKIELSGASESEISVDTKNMEIECSGASNLVLMGNTENLKAEVSGASRMNAYNFKSTTANVSASGASEANVYVLKNLLANASGASSIHYKGTSSVTKKSSGASSVSEQ